MKRDSHRIVIAGAGVAGLCTAALLARSSQSERLRLTVVDAGEAAPWNAQDDVGLRVSALSVGSLQLLATFGVDAQLHAARTCPYRDMRVWDHDSEARAADALHFSAADFALPQLGFIVEDALVRDRLRALLEGSDVDLRSGCGIEAVQAEQGGYRVELADGEHLRADLLVGADGARSLVRESVGIEVKGWRYPQAALVTHVHCERAHEHTAWQRFLPHGPIALLPLADGRVSIVWSSDPDTVKEALQSSDDELSRRLTAASGEVLGQLRVSGPRGSFPLAAQHATTYVGRGVALIGDAAHTVHPLAGQGANLGLADAGALCEALQAALARGEYPGDRAVLRRYERARRGANTTMLHFIDALNRLFASDAPLMPELRRSGMRLFNQSGALKERAMRVALGL